MLSKKRILTERVSRVQPGVFLNGQQNDNPTVEEAAEDVGGQLEEEEVIVVVEGVDAVEEEEGVVGEEEEPNTTCNILHAVVGCYILNRNLVNIDYISFCAVMYMK